MPSPLPGTIQGGGNVLNSKWEDLIRILRIRVLDRTPRNDDLSDDEALRYLSESEREIFRWCVLFAPWVCRETRVDTVFNAPGMESPIPPLVFTMGFIGIHSVEFVNTTMKVLKTIPRQSDSVNDEYQWYPTGLERIDFNKRPPNGTIIYTQFSRARLLIPTLGKEFSSIGQSVPQTHTLQCYFPQLFDDVILAMAHARYCEMRGMDSTAERGDSSKAFTQLQHMLNEMNPSFTVGEYYQNYHPVGYVGEGNWGRTGLW